MRARLIAMDLPLPERARWRVLCNVSPPSLSIVKRSKQETPCNSLATAPCYTDSLTTTRLQVAKVGNVHGRTVPLLPCFLGSKEKRGRYIVLVQLYSKCLGFFSFLHHLPQLQGPVQGKTRVSLILPFRLILLSSSFTIEKTLGICGSFNLVS